MTISGAENEACTFEHVIVAYERQVARVALRLLGRPDEAQDATQEVFLRLFRHLPKLRDSSLIGAWLYRVTVNVCRDAIRRRPPFSNLDRDYASASPNPENSSDLEQRKRMLAAAMTGLTERERECVTLHDIEGLSTREVSEIAGCSEATVRSHLSNARASLREFVARRPK